MAVDQESLQPGGEQTADSQIKQDTPHRGKRFLNLGLADLPINPLAKRFLWTSARLLTVGTVLGTAISDFIFHPTPDVNAGSTTSITALHPDNLKPVEATNNEYPPNPLKFKRNTGEDGEFFIRHLTDGVFSNGRIGIIDITEVYLSEILRAKSQAPYRLYPEDTYQIATSGNQYHPADLVFSVDTYFRQSEVRDFAHLVIRVVPFDKIDDPNAHSLLNITLPVGIVTGDSVGSFQFAPDFSYLDVATKNYIDKNLNRINRVYFDTRGIATGKIDILQYSSSYKIGLAVILDSSK